MLDWEKSLWALDSNLWDVVWLRLWRQFENEPTPEGKLFCVGDLVRGVTRSEFGFRSLEVYRDDNPQRPSRGANPLLFEIGCNASSLPVAHQLAIRVWEEAKKRGWRARLCRADEGFHVEVDPRSVSGGSDFADQDAVESFRQTLNDFSAPYEEFGVVLNDRPPVMMQVDGWREGKPGLKQETHPPTAMPQGC